MLPIQDTIRSHTVPIVNWLIIVANVAIFLFEVSLRPGPLDRFVHSYALIPQRFVQDVTPQELMTVLSSMFLHGGWFHLISNMWALYLFGDNVEDRMGHLRYLVFYGVCGVVAAMAHILIAANSPVPVLGGERRRSTRNE